MRDAFPVRGVLGGFFQWKRTSQRSALDHLHHQVIGTNIVEMANVRMVERSDDVSLSCEAFTEPCGADFVPLGDSAGYRWRGRLRPCRRRRGKTQSGTDPRIGPAAAIRERRSVATPLPRPKTHRCHRDDWPAE